MNRTRLLNNAAIIVLLAVPLVRAEAPRPALTGPPEEQFVFADSAQAQRFADALLVLTASNRQAPDMCIAVDENKVQLKTDPAVIRQVRLLAGSQKKDGKPQKGQPNRRGPELEIGVFPLSHANGRHLVDLVEMVGVGSRTPFVCNHDRRTHTIIVKATPALLAQSKALIQQLDKPTPSGEGGNAETIVELLKLSHGDPHGIADAVGRFVRCGVYDVGIVAYPRTNTVVISGTHEQVAEVVALVRQLDVKGVARPVKATKKASKRKRNEAKKAHPKTKPSETAEPDQPPSGPAAAEASAMDL